MPCDTVRQPNQSLSERKAQVKKTIKAIAEAVARGRVKVTVGPQGAIAFVGIPESERNRVTDACIYRQIMIGDSALAKAAIMRAEQISGRRVNKQIVGQGIHSHDGGKTWHDKG